jgi:hypothetical protein
MDTTTAMVLIVLAFVLIVVTAFLVFRQKGRVEIKGPLGAELKLDASNEASPLPPAVKVEDAKAKKGGLIAEDKTGRGAQVSHVETLDDILVSSSSPEDSGNPKATPPA